MPKLRKISTYIETTDKTIDANLSYSENFFRVALPAEFEDFANAMTNIQDHTYGRHREDPQKNNTFNMFRWRTAGHTKIGPIGKTEFEAVEKWTAFIKHFHDQKQTVEKVILYEVKFSSLSTDDEDTDKAIRKFKAGKHKRARTAHYAGSEYNAARIFFDWMVAEKRTIGKQSRLYFVDQDGEVGLIKGQRDWEQIPYTQEAETFFSNIYNGLEGIMEKFSQFLGTKDRTLNSIETSQKLLA